MGNHGSIVTVYSPTKELIRYEDEYGKIVAHFKKEDEWGHKQLSVTDHGLNLGYMAYNGELLNRYTLAKVI